MYNKIIKFEDLHKYHKMLWEWLRKNPDQEKHDWPEWRKNGGSIDAISCFCFACEVDKRISTRKLEVEKCRYCPITWEDGLVVNGVFISDCGSRNSEYAMWNKSTDSESKSKLAAIIRDLPWKEKF